MERRLLELVASTPERVPGWLWGFAAGVVVCVAGPAAGGFVFVGGMLCFYVVALVVVLPDQNAPGAPMSIPPELAPHLRRSVLTMVAGLAAMLVSAVARVSIFYLPLEVMYLLIAVMVVGLVALSRWLVRQHAAKFATGQPGTGDHDAA